MLFSSEGKVVCFEENEVRPMGREAGGVRGMNLPEQHKLIALIIASEGTVLTVTENGYGKRTELAEFPRHHRGGQGVIAMQASERNGAVVGAALVNDSDEIMLITDAGTLVRTRVQEISVLGRNTQGVRVIRPSEGEKLAGVERIEALNGEEGESEEDTGPEGGP
jgi:DNA gyrase subunit A